MDKANFKAAVERAGLKQIRVGDTYTYIVWKPGMPTGWLVRLGGWECFCSECFSLYSNEYDLDVVRQIDNIGLTAVAVGLLDESYDCESAKQDLRAFGVDVIPLGSSDIYSAFLSARSEACPQT